MGVWRGGEEEDVTCAEAGAGEAGEADGAAGLHRHGRGGGHGADHGSHRPAHSEYRLELQTIHWLIHYA